MRENEPQVLISAAYPLADASLMPPRAVSSEAIPIGITGVARNRTTVRNSVAVRRMLPLARATWRLLPAWLPNFEGRRPSGNVNFAPATYAKLMSCPKWYSSLRTLPD